MKKCSICKEFKYKSGFNKKSSRKDGLQPHCRECSKTRFKAYYNSNKEKHKKEVKRNSEKYKNRNREFVYQYLLLHSCVDCGEVNPVKLQFDHISDKINNVSFMATYPTSIEKLSREIDKCEVRCANCHQEKTAKEHGYWIYTRHYK